jgi:hypothetical protein
MIDVADKIAAIAWHTRPIVRGRQHEHIGVSIHGPFAGHSLPAVGYFLFASENFPVRVREFASRGTQADDLLA